MRDLAFHIELFDEFESREEKTAGAIGVWGFETQNDVAGAASGPVR
jgi:hypothetical protein